MHQIQSLAAKTNDKMRHCQEIGYWLSPHYFPSFYVCYKNE